MQTDFLGMGQQGRNLNPFSLPPAYTTPGIGDGLPGAIPMKQPTSRRPGMFGNLYSAATAHGQPPEAGAGFSHAPISLMAPDATLERGSSLPALSMMPSIAPKKPGFFDKDGAWRDVLGILADGMAGAAGMQPMYGPTKIRMRQQQSELQRRAQEEVARRAAERNEWLWREQWKQQHPDDQFTQFMVAGGAIRHSFQAGQEIAGDFFPLLVIIRQNGYGPPSEDTQVRRQVLA